MCRYNSGSPPIGTDIKRIMIRELDHFGIFRDTSFNASDFMAAMGRLGIPWPRYPSGQPILKDAEFKTCP